MSRKKDYYGNEFIGEIEKYSIDEDYIWFYDEISGGLYRLNKNDYIVEIILTPMELHYKKIFPVRQIIKWRNEIYLVPNDTSHEWLIYDITEKRLRSVLLSLRSYAIGNAVNIGKWIYLIPEKTNHILGIIETGTLSVKTVITNWYTNNGVELECWGNSIFRDMIAFPVIGTGEVFQIKGDQITKLQLHIKQPVYSVSLNENGMWILPSNGNTIFFADRNGEVIDSVEIWSNGYKNTVERFVRIISIDKYVYLFPKQGGQILVLETNNKKWTVIGKPDEPLYRSLYLKSRTMPYWGCYYNEGKLYTLPCSYHFAEIDTKNRSINYKYLQCKTLFMEQQYISWVHWMNKKSGLNHYMEWNKCLLKDLLKMKLEYNNFDIVNSIGKNIWMKMDTE